MDSRAIRITLVVLCFSAILSAAQVPVAVSPGSATGAQIGEACPTFNWGGVPGARSYDLVVYLVGDEGEEAKPVLSQRIPGTATGWTPSLDRCVEPGRRYAWSVRALDGNSADAWSAPLLFELASGPSAAEVRAVLRRYLDGGGSLDNLAGVSSPAAKPGESVETSSGRYARTSVAAELGRGGSSVAGRVAAIPSPATSAVALSSEASGSTDAGEFTWKDPLGLFDPHVSLAGEWGALIVSGDAFFVNGEARFSGDIVIPRTGVTSEDASGSDEAPEVYQILAPRGCNSTKRGEIQIMRPSGATTTEGGQDALCFCGLVTDDYYWWCFNP